MARKRWTVLGAGMLMLTATVGVKGEAEVASAPASMARAESSAQPAEDRPVVAAPYVSQAFIDSLPQRELPGYKLKLLELALDSASAMPLVPHLKPRSKMQEMVVDAYLTLDQPRAAERALRRIDNWRRGAAYGSLAIYCVQRGHVAEIENALEVAMEISKIADQDWRRDHVVGKVAQARAMLGQFEAARKLEEGFDEQDKGSAELGEATRVNEQGFEAQMNRLEASASMDAIDRTSRATSAYTQLYDTYFGDPQRRERVQERLRASWKNLPLILQIRSMIKLAEVCVQNDDAALGLTFAKEAVVLFDDVDWPPTIYLEMAGRLCKVLAQCGDAPTARERAEIAMKYFDEYQKHIESFEQAGCIRGLAEAYQAMGDTAAALELYRRVVEVGAVNPNARCRSEDLTATSVSMALHAVEPDEALWARMSEIRAGLTEPW